MLGSKQHLTSEQLRTTCSKIELDLSKITTNVDLDNYHNQEITNTAALYKAIGKYSFKK